jgi:hypothetical protein
VLNVLRKFWTGLFVAVLHFPAAAVVSGVIGAQAGLTFWIMGIAAHQPILSVAHWSFRRRVAIWLTAMTGGIVTAVLGQVAINALTRNTAGDALNGSGQVTNVFWFVVALRLALRWAPIVAAWTVCVKLVRARLSTPSVRFSR